MWRGKGDCLSRQPDPVAVGTQVPVCSRAGGELHVTGIDAVFGSVLMAAMCGKAATGVAIVVEGPWYETRGSLYS